MWLEANQGQLCGVNEMGEEGSFLGKGSTRTQHRSGNELGVFMDVEATGLVRKWNLITE